MRVLVTGASGHIASAVIPELLDNGHEVVGLARSDAAAATTAALGANVRRGDLDDHDGLTAAAADVEGVIHLAFRHDLVSAGDMDSAVATDLAATRALARGLEGSDKPLVTTNGTLMLAFGGITDRVATEEDAVAGGPRVDAENAVVGMAEQGIRSSVVRLPPLVHSELDTHGFGPRMIEMARQHGSAAYIGSGENRWPAVHTLDVGRLYRLALERAPAGSRLHAVGDEGIPFKEIAGTIASHLGVSAVSVTMEEAPDHLGFLAPLAACNNPASNRITRESLGWEPTHRSWVQDMDAGFYFAAAAH